MKSSTFFQVHLFICILLFSIGISAQNIFYKQAENTIRVMTYNIRNAYGIDEKTDIQRIADIINYTSPDIVALQELDSVTGRSKHLNIVKELSELTKMHAIYGASIDFDGGKYGIGILSKNEAASWNHIPLPGREEARSLLMVEFPEYALACTHFSLNEEDRLVSVNMINEVAAKQEKPFILSGDFNSLPASPVISKLTENWKILSNPKVFTFPADNPEETIDYILGYMGKGKTYTVLQNNVVKEPFASDHLPVFVDIRME